jgi:hypothetical protein
MLRQLKSWQIGLLVSAVIVILFVLLKSPSPPGPPGPTPPGPTPPGPTPPGPTPPGPQKKWYYKTEPLETTSNSNLWEGGPYKKDYVNDTTGIPYKRILHISENAIDSSWKEVNGVTDPTDFYSVVRTLSNGGNGNLPSDNPSSGDNGILCPAPRLTDTVNGIQDFTFANQFTTKGALSGTNMVTKDNVTNSVSSDICTNFEAQAGCSESGRFLMDSAANGYNSPPPNPYSDVYTCSNNIFNAGSMSSSFPGSLFYEDFYDSGCPVEQDQECGIGPYHINNTSGKNFPFYNEQSIPVSTQNIILVIESSGYFVPPDTVEYVRTTGNTYHADGSGGFPSLYDIPGFISEPNVVCKNKDIPWATGTLGSNDDYSNGYISSCFNVGYPLAERATVAGVPTTTNDNVPFNASQGIITITYKGKTARIKNDLSIVRNNSDDSLQTSSCFVKGFRLTLADDGNPVKFTSNIISSLIKPGDKSTGILNKKIKGIQSPCYNTTYTSDGVVRMNLTNYQIIKGNTLYLVISFDNASMNIKDGLFALITKP